MDAKLTLTRSKKDVPYYILQFEDYDLPLFGESFFWEYKELPSKGDVCSPRLIGGGWEVIGKFTSKDNVIEIFLYKIGLFKAVPTQVSNEYDVFLQDPPRNALSLLAFNAKMTIPIPTNCKYYSFIKNS